jgi:hypothetical protein
MVFQQNRLLRRDPCRTLRYFILLVLAGPERLWCGSCSLRRREIGRHFCGMSRLLFFLRVSWVSLAGCGAGEEEVAFAGVAGKGGGAFELGAGFGVAA